MARMPKQTTITSQKSRKPFSEKLHDQVLLGYKKFEWARKMRMNVLQRIAGPHYGGSRRQMRPINLLYKTYSTYAPRIVAGKTRCKIGSDTMGLYPSAKLLEMACNHLLEKNRFVNTSRTCVQDALVGIACAKTALLPSDFPYGTFGPFMYPGQPYVKRISFDDLLIDPDSADINEYYYIGNRYHIALEILKNGDYDKRAIEQLERADEAFNRPDQRTEDISRGDEAPKSETYDFLELVEVYDNYCPTHNVVITMGWSEGATRPLAVRPWEGPEGGPYDFMYFTPLADNFMPIPPLWIMYDMDDAANEWMRKLIRRMKNSKHNLAYESRAADDAENILGAEDLEAVRVDNVSGLKELDFNGPKTEDFIGLNFLTGQANDIAGNPDLLGGTSADSGTLGQEQMLLAGANVRVTDARDQMNQFGANIARKFAWYLMHVPGFKIPLTRRPVPGVEINTEYSREMIEGDFLDFHYNFTSYSRLEMDPVQRYQKLAQFTGEIVPMQIQLQMQTQGAWPAQKVIRMMADYLDIEGWDEIEMDEMAFQRTMARMEAYQFPGQGQSMMPGQASGQGAQSRSPRLGGKNMGMNGQNAYGARSSSEMTNGSNSGRPQNGMLTPSGG